MFNFMLDTDICSYIIRERPIAALEKFNKHDISAYCISTVTEAELRYGIAHSQRPKYTAASVEPFLERMMILHWDSEAAKTYGQLRAYLKAKGHMIGNMDMMIAAHALSIDAAIVTNNKRHFAQVPKLSTVNWL